jgi:lipopolysaccharide export system protein LptA
MTAFVLAVWMGTAHAQSPVALDSKKPIEISADALEVLQAKNTAVFTGNVIAKQGAITMNAAQMTVSYRKAGAEGQMGSGIYRLSAEGKVLFTTPAETAQGDSAIYDVDNKTIHLAGNVLLNRNKNVLKGSKLDYNLATGRSVLIGSSAQPGGRVQGLFVPEER